MKTGMTSSQSANPPQKGQIDLVLPVASLARRGDNPVSLVPGADALAGLAADLALLGLRKVTLKGAFYPVGKRDWQLKAHLGATVVQPCIVTLKPVTTRIEEDIERLWSANADDIPDTGPEEEMPEDTSLEKLGKEIDVGQVLREALALALPLYPRVKDASLDTAHFAAPGTKPMSDEDARPFAGLAALRGQLDPSDTGGNDGGTDGESGES